MKTPTKKKIIYIICAVLIAAFLIIPFLYADYNINFAYTERNNFPPIFYGIMTAFSIAILSVYTIFIKKKYIWVMFSFIATAIVNAGYFAQSLSSNVSEALLANRISYLGNVFLLLFMIFTVANACKIKYDFGVKLILFSISVIMYLFAATQGFLDLFYKNVSFTIIDGYVKIQKEYGPMHTVYSVYIFAYLLIIIGTIIYAIKKKKLTSPKYILAISFFGIFNVSVWFIEQFVDNKIENLAFTYVVTELFLLWIYYRMVTKGVLDTYTITMTLQSENSPGKTLDIIVENSTDAKLFTDRPAVDFSKLSVDELKEIIKKLPADNRLTDRELEVAVLLLQDLKRKEMATSLFVSEDTVKTHSSHIYGKLNIAGKKELHKKAEMIINNNQSD